MRDDLSRIESSYGCVAEYNRCCYEEDSRKAERIEKDMEKFRKNREKRKNARKNGYCIISCGDMKCGNCPHADFDTRRDYDDDMGDVICMAPDGTECRYRDYEMLPYAWRVFLVSPDGKERLFGTGKTEEDAEDLIAHQALGEENGELYILEDGIEKKMVLRYHSDYTVLGYDKDNDVFCPYETFTDFKDAMDKAKEYTELLNRGELKRNCSDGTEEPIDWIEIRWNYGETDEEIVWGSFQ